MTKEQLYELERISEILMELFDRVDESRDKLIDVENDLVNVNNRLKALIEKMR